MQFEGPEPRTDREYLIRIFELSRSTHQTVDELCARVNGQETRVDRLESWHDKVAADCIEHDLDIKELKRWKIMAAAIVAFLLVIAAPTLTLLRFWGKI